ncbi:hypothetical protein LPJ73_001584, partial [Coemansia sp. RSA 2703]
MSGPAVRPSVEAGQPVKAIMVAKEPHIVPKGVAGSQGVTGMMVEGVQLEDKHMAKMERRMNNICALLRDLMAVRQMEQYYAEAEVMLTPMGG